MRYLIILLLSSTCLCQDSIDDLRKEFGSIVTELWAQPNGTQGQGQGSSTTRPNTLWTENDQGCICVEYYNCDADTNTILTDGKKDGFGIIDIRFGQGQGEARKKCEHFLDVCCMPPTTEIPGGNGNGEDKPTFGEGGQTGSGTGTGGQTGSGTGTGGQTGSGTGTIPTRPPSTVAPPLEGPVRCGIRNPKGVGFQIKGNENHESEYAEFPWMVALLRTDYDYGKDTQDKEKNLALCGASLIDRNVVLTGAHCVEKYSPHQLKIRAGEWDTQTGREQYPYQEREVSRIIMHEGFNPKTVYNAIALLILKTPVEYAQNVKPVCLPKQGQQFQQKECYVSGWGKKSFGKVGQLSVILKKIDLPIVNRRQCEADLRKTRLGKLFNLHESFICAGGVEGKDACTGDGGGPLVCPESANSLRYEQAGIVAWGIGCGQANVPGVYAGVAQFRNWIDNHMKKLGFGISAYTM